MNKGKRVWEPAAGQMKPSDLFRTRLPEGRPKRRRGPPYNREQERERRRRQIERGQLKAVNGAFVDMLRE